MESMYSPLLVRNPTWPESVRNEFSSGMNRFLGSLTDELNRIKSRTVLYVPNEDLSAPMAALIANKELIQRLEATVIHWTTQIKDVLSSANAEKTARPNEMPLDEIDYWFQRVNDLSGISIQLDKPGVSRIVAVLTEAKSAYLAQFSLLASNIKDSMAEAKSNARFLGLLKQDCTNLMKLDINKLHDCLSTIADTIRVVWITSDYYNTRERVTVIFQKVLLDSYIIYV
jgi:dynein heavy chain